MPVCEANVNTHSSLIFFIVVTKYLARSHRREERFVLAPGIKGRQAGGGSSGLWQQEAACLHLSRSRSRDETESGTENLKAGR